MIIRPLKKRRSASLSRKAVTIEERLWTFVAEQAQQLAELASDEDAEPAQKKLVAGSPFKSLKNALRQLGAIK